MVSETCLPISSALSELSFALCPDSGRDGMVETCQMADLIVRPSINCRSELARDGRKR
ncbi:hypothetical protein EMIT0P12_110059 [Pseudomonas sp. IT-P12]